MSLVGYKAKNHRQQVQRRGANPAIDDRATTPEDFDPLNQVYEFTIDVAASVENAKVRRYFTVEMDGLAQPWTGERVWCNPPHSACAAWVEKAWLEAHKATVIVMLLPANRTEQAWWQNMVEPFRDRPGSWLRVKFLRGRLRFIAPGQSEVGPNERPPYGCCLLIWTDPTQGAEAE